MLSRDHRLGEFFRCYRQFRMDSIAKRPEKTGCMTFVVLMVEKHY